MVLVCVWYGFVMVLICFWYVFNMVWGWVWWYLGLVVFWYCSASFALNLALLFPSYPCIEVMASVEQNAAAMEIEATVEQVDGSQVEQEALVESVEKTTDVGLETSPKEKKFMASFPIGDEKIVEPLIAIQKSVAKDAQLSQTTEYRLMYADLDVNESLRQVHMALTTYNSWVTPVFSRTIAIEF